MHSTKSNIRPRGHGREGEGRMGREGDEREEGGVRGRMGREGDNREGEEGGKERGKDGERDGERKERGKDGGRG